MHIERPELLLDIYQMTLGAMKYSNDRMLERLEERGYQEGVELAKLARKQQKQAMRLQLAWDQTKQEDPLSRQGTMELDGRIDETLSAVVQTAEAQTHLPEGHENREYAEELLDDLFPSGVFPITSKPFTDQYARVAELVSHMREEYGDHLDALGLRELVGRLEDLNEQFGDLLEPDDKVEYDEVEAAYVEAEDAFHRVVVAVMHEYFDDREALNDVLHPVLEQIERTRRHLQRRGTIPEVDPETGEPIEETDGEPIDGETDPDEDPENEVEPEEETDTEDEEV